MLIPKERHMTNLINKTQIGLVAGGVFFALVLLGSILFIVDGPGTVEPTAAKAPQEIPANWISVKYRDTPVDLSAMEPLLIQPSGDLLAAWYDSDYEYLVVNLRGVYYHYCGFPSADAVDLEESTAGASFYRENIRGSFDCRIQGTIPDY